VLTRSTRIQWRAPAVARPRTTSPKPLRYLPQLDGVRALAVIAVFAFHAGFGWASGGFLGVSVFFTLSGYLITRLLLDGVAAERAVDLLKFWSRRIRRLLPAALVTIGLVLLLAATVLRVSPDAIRGDALATIGYVANWRFLFAGQSYQSLFTAPSPLLHFWSLAIEEQFYLVYPIVLAVVVGACRGHRVRERLRIVLLGGLGLSLLATVLAVQAGDGDFVYYSTPTRAAELLTGALLGCSLAGSTLAGANRRRWALPLGIGALATIALLCATTTGTTSWVTHGGLPMFSLLSVTLVAAALPHGPFASALSVAPLRGLGKISYGVYLYHWPVILWLDQPRVGLSGVELAGVQAAVTLAISVVSYTLIERPIRTGRFPRGATARLAPAVAIAGVCAVAIVATSTMQAPAGFDLQATSDKFSKALASHPATESSGDTGVEVAGAVAVEGVTKPDPVLSRLAGDGVSLAPMWDTAAPKPRVAVFGDSTAMAEGLGLLEWGQQTGAFSVVDEDTGMGCAIARGGLIKFMDRAPDNPFPKCGDWGVDWAGVVSQSHPDVAVIIDGPFDVTDRLLPGDTQWRAIGDPVFDQYLKSEMLAATDLFLSRGVRVVWVTTPRFEAGHWDAAPKAYPENDPARVRRFNRMLDEVAKERPGITVIDFRTWLRQTPGGELDWSLRPDGMHFSDAAAVQVAGWLGPAILSAVRPPPPAPAPSPSSA